MASTSVAVKDSGLLLRFLRRPALTGNSAVAAAVVGPVLCAELLVWFCRKPALTGNSDVKFEAVCSLVGVELLLRFCRRPAFRGRCVIETGLTMLLTVVLPLFLSWLNFCPVEAKAPGEATLVALSLPFVLILLVVDIVLPRLEECVSLSPGILDSSTVHG